jgi:CDGSH-type Zn-finger protein
MNDKTKASITLAPDGPYLVADFENFSSRNGAISSQSKMALCRCGKSANKPYCDGSHKAAGFSSAKDRDRLEDKRADYEGATITIHDNRAICAHAGVCTDGLPSVFRVRQEPFVDPNGGTQDEIMAVVRKCPSGALSYSIDGVEQVTGDSEEAIFIAPDGPYVVTGGPNLVGTTFGEGVSSESFTLCRCGESKNKPFCDGTHWSTGFSDDKN